MTYQPSVYMAGPIQHVNDYGKGWRAHVRQEYDGIDWIDPTDMEDPTEAAAEGNLGGTEQLVEDEIRIVREADGMLVHWEEVPTCGTPMEMVYGQTANLWDDCRTSTFVVTQTTVPEDDLSAFLTYHTDVMVESFDEAVETLEHALWADRGRASDEDALSSADSADSARGESDG
jgi:hypothetical protein